MMKKKLVFSKRRPNTLMKFTRVKSFVLLPILAMIMAGCGQSNAGTTPATEKQDVSISIAIEDGKQFNENEFVAPTVTVNPSSLTPTITYYKGETSLGDAVPQTVGDYKITATTAETGEYNAGLASKSFLIRKVPTLSFYYGDNQPLDEGHKFNLDEGDFNIYAKASIAEATISYSYLGSDGTAINGKPNAAGVYYLMASVERTSTIGSTSATCKFELITGSGPVAVDPTIRFFYDGEEKCISGSNWLNEGYGDTTFNANDFDVTKLTYTVSPSGAQYSVAWTLNDNPIEAPSNPLASGTYALTITVTANEVANAGVKWALFAIK